MNATSAAIALSAFALSASAEPISGIYTDIPDCDNHGFQQAVEEFGDPAIFASDEAIDHVSTFTQIPACPPMDNPTIPNRLVLITNLTGRFLDNLYYVGDPETSFSNVDGLGFGAGSPTVAGLAFRIDSFGLNRPLIFESLTFDGIFEPGETWRFIVQDYAHLLGLPPDAFFSIGMAGDSPFVAGTAPSTASIVRFVPAPGTAALAGVAVLAAARRRR